jgi:hypothetical protein
MAMRRRKERAAGILAAAILTCVTLVGVLDSLLR